MERLDSLLHDMRFVFVAILVGQAVLLSILFIDPGFSRFAGIASTVWVNLWTIFVLNIHFRHHDAQHEESK